MCFISANATLSNSATYWLGGSDNAAKGTYMWESGVEVDSPFSHQAWSTGEPSGDTDTQCIGAVGSSNLQYDAIGCETTNKYVCEY